MYKPEQNNKNGFRYVKLTGQRQFKTGRFPRFLKSGLAW